MEVQKLDPDSVKKTVKKLDDYLWSITNNVVCSICHEIFIDPITIPCSHSFCSNCFKRLLSGENTMGKGCPLCRKSIKRREVKNNFVMKNISKMCFGLFSAYKKDVMNFGSDLEELAKDLVDGSRLAGVYSDKDKKNCNKNVKKQRKTKKKERKVPGPYVDSSGEETNSKNNESQDFKSVSQIELKSQLYVAESPEIEKKLRTVKRVPSKEKVNDWLEKVGKTCDPGPSISADILESRDESIIQGTETKKFSRSAKSLDFGNCEKPSEMTEKNFNSTVGDPYEFIASQRSYGAKTRKKTVKGRGRRKTLPEFASIQNFTKDSIKKSHSNKTTDLFDDISDYNLQKTRKTYSRKSDKTATIGEKTQEMLLGDYGKIMSDSEELDSGSDIMPRRRRRVFPLCGDIDSDSSAEIKGKKRRLGSVIVISDCESEGQKPEDESVRTGTALKNSKARDKGPAMVPDVETAEKSRRSRRKILDISGGEPSLNGSRKSVPEECTGDDDVPNNDVVMEDLSQNAEGVVGFEDPSSAEKKKNFKLMVEKMEEDLEFETSYAAKEFSKGNSSSAGESVFGSITRPPQKETQCDTPKNKTIPFALLGKIKKKKRSSIIFVKLGRLSSSFRYPRSRSTVVKLIFPKTIHKNRRKDPGKVTVETQTYSLAFDKQDKGLQTVEYEKVDCKEQKLLNAEIQTTESFLQSDSKEAQTSPRVEQRSVTVQTVEVETESLALERGNTQLLKSQGNNSEVMCLDSELESQFNKTWVTQGKKQTDIVELSAAKKESDKPAADPFTDDMDALMQRVIDNIDIDSARAKTVSESPVKQPQQCEESDSDIFIEQTPPRNKSKNSSVLHKTQECGAANPAEESFLILSDCQSKVPDSVNTSKIFEQYSQRNEEKSFEKFFPKEGDENDRNELNLNPSRTRWRIEKRPRKMCIASSGVINRENIEKFVKKFNVEHLSSPRKTMTHLVVGLHKNEDGVPVPYCTPKLLFAIANKLWVVTEAWIESCLKAEVVVPEEPFESPDPDGGNGCSVARRSTDFLLRDCEICLYGNFASIAENEFSSLITDCGGTVVENFRFTYKPKRIRMILVDDPNEHEEKETRDLMEKYCTLVMPRDVIIMSMQSYKLVNFTPFLICNVPYPKMVRWGYPPDLVTYDYDVDRSGSE